MSVVDARGRRSTSPPGSGRSSPVPRATRRTAEDGIYKADKNLKRYAAYIERALSSWEIAPEEWADYIAFLGRLLKAIQAHPKDAPILPHSSAIATRLAQCLNPALPSGVHQKSLEVYAYIFSTFGDAHIATHLHEYLPGLSAVLSFASLSVRPGVYTLFEDNIVGMPISELRPALKSLILALLPVLEEETSEDFDRALAILCHLESSFVPNDSSDDLAQETDGYFWQCVFLAVITSPSRRQGALNYLSRRLPSLAPPRSVFEDRDAKISLSREAECLTSPEPGLLIRCFVCGLSDAQLLVQRGFLDLLVTHLPLHSAVLQTKVGKDELDKVVSAASLVLLRRDMSLNRRLWTWFLGPEPKDQDEGSQPSSPSLKRKTSNDSSENTQLRYFTSYGRSSLQRCILKMFERSEGDPARRARPFRICLSLMDRWEIGGLLVPQVFMPAMNSLYRYSRSVAQDAVAEVVRSASLFFDGVEASLIWACLVENLKKGFEGHQSLESSIEMLLWIIKTFSVQDEEMLTTHIPTTLLYILTLVNTESATTGTRTLLLDASRQLLDLIPSRLYNTGRIQSPKATHKPDADDDALRKRIETFYIRDKRTMAKMYAPLDLDESIALVCVRTAALQAKALNRLKCQDFLQVTGLLRTLMSKSNDASILDGTALRESLMTTFGLSGDRPVEVPFPIINAAIPLMHTIRSCRSASQCLSTTDIVDMEPSLTAQLWINMSPSKPKYNVEAVKAFWLLGTILPNEDALVASLAALVRDITDSKSVSHREEMTRRFTVLWGHSMPAENPKSGSVRRGSAMPNMADSKQLHKSLSILEPALLLVLDALSDQSDAAFHVVKTWLQSLPSLELIFQRLLSNLGVVITQVKSNNEPDPDNPIRNRKAKARELEYILRHIEQILVHSTEWTWRSLEDTLLLDRSGTSEVGALAFLTESCVRLLGDEQASNLSMNRHFVAILDLLLSSPVALELRDLELDKSLLDILMASMDGKMAVLQGHILGLIQVALKLRLASQSADHRPASGHRASTGSKRPSTAQAAHSSTNLASTKIGPEPPRDLFKCLRKGFSSVQSRRYLDSWLAFLAEVLPTFADAIFANLLPLVGTLCDEVTKILHDMLSLSQKSELEGLLNPESVALNLLDAMQMVLDRAYDCLIDEAAFEPTAQEPAEKPNFFNNVRSNVFKAEGPPSRTAKSNSRLTFILALQDALRVALKAWLWSSSPADVTDFDEDSAATTAFRALKLRHKTRQTLENLFSLEPLESLEVVMSHWIKATKDEEASSTMSVLHVLQMSRPKNVVPAVLDALCSRLNPSAIPAARQSTLTMDLKPSEIATFFSAYLESTEDDAMDEVWSDCIAFLRDVLLDPLRYGRILPNLLSVIMLLGQKLNNTNFGEQRRMRRDLGDILQRLLNATLTALAPGYVAESAQMNHASNGIPTTRHSRLEDSTTLLPVLSRVVEHLDIILETSERSTVVVSDITTRLIAPTLRSKTFPRNVEAALLELLVRMSKKAPGAKTWKKEMHDLFQESNTKLLASSEEMMRDGWFPLLHQWTLHDKERMPELLSRLTPPSSAGAVFGIGASAARLAEDRRTQYNLRRICLLLMASPEDTYVAHLRLIEEKAAELFQASAASSPSANIKADLFMLCRTLAVSVSNVHLSPLWPIINDKLHAALISLLPSSKTSDEFNNLTLLQACKLLDLLIALGPDEFQLHEWLYITDTIDAVYQPADWSPVALCDQVAEALGSASMEDSIMPTNVTDAAASQRRPLLSDDLGIDQEDIKALPRDEFIRSVLRPFLSQLSIHAYEGVYSLESADVGRLRSNLLTDLLNLGSIAE